MPGIGIIARVNEWVEMNCPRADMASRQLVSSGQGPDAIHPAEGDINSIEAICRIGRWVSFRFRERSGWHNVNMGERKKKGRESVSNGLLHKRERERKRGVERKKEDKKPKSRVAAARSTSQPHDLFRRQMEKKNEIRIKKERAK